jgi:cellulose synthase/poly-beta-1,6-N-acetylglucosamine synthase-like glycosyltransferase
MRTSPMNHSDAQQIFEKFSLENYNSTIEKIIERKKIYFGNLFLSSGLTSVLFTKMQSVSNIHDLIIYSMKFTWLLPLPIFALANIGRYKILNKNDLEINVERIKENKNLSKNKIIFQIVTKGNNVKVLERSILSIRYWITKIFEKHNIKINSEIWVIVDEENKDNVEFLRKYDVKIIEVPKNFNTNNNTKYKARALQYANLLRRKFGINNSSTWIYHQDEETCIGEDTILGILDFISNGEKLIGCGIILYPLDWENKVTYTEELLRSSDDIRILSLIKDGKLPFGYHGSHFLVRADIEEEIGWDYGENRAEDMLFHLKAQVKYSKNIGLLKGFAYEKAPSTVKDFLKQRTRWLKGSLDTLKSNELTLNHKLMVIFSLIVWYAAIPSMMISIISLFYQGGISPFLGFTAGFVWYSLIDNYRLGYELNSIYLDKEIKLARLVINMIAGALLEAFVPWYALFYKPNGFEVIKKD